MRRLILIKHAKPAVVEGVPSEEWSLSEEGRRACGPLAAALRQYDIRRLVSSEEPKAAETATLVAESLDVSPHIAPGLHEHDRSNVPMMATRDFISSMAHFFKEHARRVLGRESADETAERFNAAVNEVIASQADGDVAIVTHGTVLAIFAAANGGGDPFKLWRQLGLPSLAVFQLPDKKLLEIVDRI
jgi:broad specificity phosphatase PhoE